MTARKIYTFRLNDVTPDDHVGRLGEITYRSGYLYYHDGETAGGELINGGGIDVYRNGVLLTPNATGYNQPSSPASNTLLFGARHNNDGTGSTDTIGSANFYYYDVQSQAQTAEQVAANYENIRSSYGI